MFLHIGGEIVVLLEDVIAILSLDSPEQSKTTKEFLKTAREEGFVVDVGNGKPSSFVLTTEKVYISPISAQTLKRRAGLIDFSPEPGQENGG